MKIRSKTRLAVATGALAFGLAAAQPAHSFIFGWFFGGGSSNDEQEEDAGPGYTETEHPIVLVHGLSGFDSMFGLVRYFSSIPRTLERDGAVVYTPQVSASNSNEVRGEQLLEQIEEIIATTDAEKVNIIGHSQGSPTARYVAGVAPELVASVTGVGGVNWGTRVADNAQGGLVGGTLSVAGNVLFTLLDLGSFGGLPQNTARAIESLSTEGSIAFNEEFPAGIPSEYCAADGEPVVDGIRYYSWGGDRVFTNALDPSSSVLYTTSTGINEPNDGLVPVCSMQLGEIIGLDFRLNHLDQVNQVGGLTAWGINPKDIYRQHANRLQNEGL